MSAKQKLADLPEDERRKISQIMRDKEGNGDNATAWMYEQPKKEAEDYLLGKQVKGLEELAEISRDQAEETPEQRLSRLDMQAKFREDPLNLMRQHEFDRRSALLQNTAKVKRLKRLIEQQEHQQKKIEKKKKKKKRKHSSSSSDDSEDDAILDQFISLIQSAEGMKKKERVDSKPEIEIPINHKRKHSSEKKKPKKHHHHKQHKSKSTERDYISLDANATLKTLLPVILPMTNESSQLKLAESSPRNSETQRKLSPSQNNPPIRHRIDRSPVGRRHVPYSPPRRKVDLPKRHDLSPNDKRKNTNQRRHRRSSSSSRSPQTRLQVNRSPGKQKSRSSSRQISQRRSPARQKSRSPAKSQRFPVASKPRRTAAEMAALREQMAADAKERDVERTQRFEAHKTEKARLEAEELASKATHGASFLKGLTLDHVATTSIEEGIQRKANSRQRGGMNESFLRR